MPSRKRPVAAALKRSPRKSGAALAALPPLPEPTGEVRDQVCAFYSTTLRPGLEHIAGCLKRGANKPGDDFDQKCFNYGLLIEQVVVALDAAVAEFCPGPDEEAAS